MERVARAAVADVLGAEEVVRAAGELATPGAGDDGDDVVVVVVVEDDKGDGNGDGDARSRSTVLFLQILHLRPKHLSATSWLPPREFTALELEPVKAPRRLPGSGLRKSSANLTKTASRPRLR